MKIVKSNTEIFNTDWHEIKVGQAFYNPGAGVCIKVMTFDGIELSFNLDDGQQRMVTSPSQVIPDAVIMANYGKI